MVSIRNMLFLMIGIGFQFEICVCVAATQLVSIGNKLLSLQTMCFIYRRQIEINNTSCFLITNIKQPPTIIVKLDDQTNTIPDSRIVPAS